MQTKLTRLDDEIFAVIGGLEIGQYRSIADGFSDSLKQLSSDARGLRETAQVLSNAAEIIEVVLIAAAASEVADRVLWESSFAAARISHDNKRAEQCADARQAAIAKRAACIQVAGMLFGAEAEQRVARQSEERVRDVLIRVRGAGA